MAKAPVAERTRREADAAGLPEAEIRALAEARHADPFSVLGMHATGGGVAVRALVPDADARTGES